MIAGLDIKDIVELALLLIATGALSGFLAGVFGIGGGAILVPVFYECFRIAGVPLEVRMPLCIGTSLAVIIPTSIRSFQAHYKRGAVDMAILRVWWLPIVVGVVAGSVIARYAPERLFKIVFVCVAYSAAARLIFAREGWKLGDDLPKGPLMRAYGFCVGILSTLMGIGGGLFSNLLMTFYGRPIHQAVATSSALGGADLDPRRARLHLCGLAGGGELSGRRSAADPVRARLRLADRSRARDADEPRHRAARRESCTCDVEADAGSGVRVLSVDRRQPVCAEPGGRAVVAASTVIRAQRRRVG
ncbi:putative membrane protein YfcA [Bradyrhizobium ottawaense]